MHQRLKRTLLIRQHKICVKFQWQHFSPATDRKYTNKQWQTKNVNFFSYHCCLFFWKFDTFYGSLFVSVSSVAWEGYVHGKCAQVLYCVIKICILFILGCDLIWQSTNSCHFCTPQPHFQPHDLPWPSSLRIVHCRIVMNTCREQKLSCWASHHKNKSYPERLRRLYPPTLQQQRRDLIDAGPQMHPGK